MSLILALDFGGTKLSAGLLERGSRAWLDKGRGFSEAGATAENDLSNMSALAQKLLAGRAPAAVGVSFGGPVDAREGRVLLSDHVAGWEDVALKKRLEALYRAPVAVDNDANVAALGEAAYGAGPGLRQLALRHGKYRRRRRLASER